MKQFIKCLIPTIAILSLFSIHSRSGLLQDFLELETSFSTIIARLCEAVLKHGSRGNNCGNDDGFSNEELSRQVQATLRRLIDQFQSVVDLNSSLREKDDVSDDEEIIEKWVAEAFGEKDGREKMDEKKEGRSQSEEPQQSSGLTGKSRKRNVGTQAKERKAEKADKNEQTDKKSFENDKFIAELKDENRLLRNEVVAVETDLREMQKLHHELEKRFEEENTAKVTAMKQLEEMADPSCRQEPTGTLNRIEDITQTEVDTPAAQHVTRSTKSIATCTISSVSLSSLTSVTSTDSEPLSVTNGKEPTLCIRQRSRALKSEIGRLRDVYSDVEDELSRLAEENKTLRLRITRLNREGKELKNNAEHANQTCEEYKMEIKNLDRLNTHLEAKLSEVRKEKNFIGEKLESATEELSSVDVDRRKALRELTDLAKKFKTLTEDKHRLSEEFGKLEKAHLEESTKAAKLTKSTAESEVQLGILRGQVGDMTVEINQLRAENQTNSEARQRAERDLRKLEADLRAVRKVNGELSTEVLQTKSKVGSLEDTIRHLESENAALTQQTVHLEAAKAALSKQAAEAEATIRLMTSNNKELVSESYRLKKENLELRTSVEEMNMVNIHIRTQLDNWGKDSADIGKRMKQLGGVKTELQSFIRQLTSVNSNIEKRFETMDSEYTNLERRLQLAGKADDDDGTTSLTAETALMALQEIDWYLYNLPNTVIVSDYTVFALSYYDQLKQLLYKEGVCIKDGVCITPLLEEKKSYLFPSSYWEAIWKGSHLRGPWSLMILHQAIHRTHAIKDRQLND